MKPAVLGIDPGTRKCGYAVITETAAPPLALGIVPIEALAQTVAALASAYTLRAIALGGGTHARRVAGLLIDVVVPIAIVDERETTLRARARFFAVHPPTGWRRLVPRGMLMPPRSLDDYAALLIAERYFELVLEGKTPPGS